MDSAILAWIIVSILVSIWCWHSIRKMDSDMAEWEKANGSADPSPLKGTPKPEANKTLALLYTMGGILGPISAVIGVLVAIQDYDEEQKKKKAQGLA